MHTRINQLYNEIVTRAGLVRVEQTPVPDSVNEFIVRAQGEVVEAQGMIESMRTDEQRGSISAGDVTDLDAINTRLGMAVDCLTNALSVINPAGRDA